MPKPKNKRKAGREIVQLQCTESGRINYTTRKNKKLHPERMELMKYSPVLRKHTLHKEVKK